MKKISLMMAVALVASAACAADKPMRIGAATQPNEAMQKQQTESEISAASNAVMSATIHKDNSAVWERNTNAVHAVFYGQSNCYGYSGDGTINFLDGFLDGISNAYTIADGYWENGTHAWSYSGILKIPTANTSAGWSMELPFAFNMTHIDGRKTYVTRVAQGGKAITNFVAGTAMFTQLTNNIAQIQSTYSDCPPPDVVVYIQGETDTGTTALANAYHDNLTNLIYQIRTAIGNPSLPFVILSLGEYQKSYSSEGQTVFNAQKSVCQEDQNCYFVDATPFDHPAGNAHYNSSGIIQGGNYVYAQVKQAILDSYKTTSLSAKTVGAEMAVSQKMFSNEGYFGSVKIKGEEVSTTGFNVTEISRPLSGYTFNVTTTNDFNGINVLDDNSTPTGNDYGTRGQYIDVSSGGLGLFETNNSPTGYMSANDFTISYWYSRQHSDSDTSYRYIFYAANTNGFTDRIYALNIQAGNQNTASAQNIRQILCVPGENSTSRTLLAQTDAATSNTWTHYTWTIEWGNKATLYVNGTYDTEATLSQSFGCIDNWYAIGTRSTTFGAYESLPALGYIDDFFIFDHALSATEVESLYKNQSSGFIGVRER